MRVTANGVQQIRELPGGAGYLSQDSSILHFALAQASRVDLVEIYWPEETLSVKVAVYDLQGRRIATLFEGLKKSGSHRVNWNGRDAGGNFVSAGIYIVQLTSEAQQMQQKITVMR